MTTEETAWGTSSGLLETCTGTIAEAWFGRNEQAEGPGADRVYLFWRLINLETEEEQDEWVARLSIGNGWEPIEGGAKVVREDGGSKPFNNSTDYGKVINRVLGQNGGKEGRAFEGQFDGAFEVLKGRGTQYQADVWVGMRFDFDTEEFSSTINGEDVTWNRLLPQRFVGMDERVAGDTSSTAPSTESVAATTPSSGSSPNGVEQQLAELARNCETHDEFVNKALQVDGVSSDQALLAKVADRGDSGLFAQAKG